VNCIEFKERIDAYIDNELSAEERAEMLEHAHNCENCNEELKYAEMLGDIMSDAAEEITPPLAAQAAWRNAIRAESRKRRLNINFRSIGAAAAALVVLVGGVAVIRFQGVPGNSDPSPGSVDNGGIVYVATDGADNGTRTVALGNDSAIQGMSASARIIAEDVADSTASVNSLISDFGGSVADSSVSEDSAYISAEIPSDKIEGFMESLTYAGNVDSSRINGDGDGPVTISITIKSE